MKNWINKISTILFPVNLIDPGVYHYQTPTNAENQFRLHLRVDPDHRGVLIINAATILHLNETATEYAYHLVKGQPPDAAAKLVAKRYQISEHEARNDFLEFKNKVFTLLEVPDLDPTSYLDMSREDPYSGAASSPYRLGLRPDLPAFRPAQFRIGSYQAGGQRVDNRGMDPDHQPGLAGGHPTNYLYRG